MQFQIEILSATTSQVPTAKGSYGRMEVAFKKDGKIEGKTIMDFAAKEAYKALLGAQQGSIFTITSEKEAGRDGKEYWVWKGATAGGTSNNSSVPSNVAATSANTSATPVKSGGSTYATSEERAKTQVYIVRQSSLSNALKYYELIGNKKITPNDIKALAQELTNFVMDTEPAAVPADRIHEGTGFDDLKDDVPY